MIRNDRRDAHRHLSDRNATRIIRVGCLALALMFASAVSQARDVPVAEARFTRLGGIDQWITIRGSSRSNPVLLILHGGPGDRQSVFVSTYAPLERSFVVVQWDQRGGGKTLSRGSGTFQSTSLEQLTSDGIELVEYLRNYLQTGKIIIVGHSWGSYLGVRIIKRRPDLFLAYVGTGQVVNWRSTIATLYRIALDRAHAEHDTAAVKGLETLGVPAFDKMDQYLGLRKWLDPYTGISDRQWMEGTSRAASAEEFQEYGAGIQASFQNSLASLSSALFAIDLPSLGYDFDVPFFLIQGSDDLFTPTDLAVRYFKAVRAPTKHLTLMAGAGHFAAMTHMQEFVTAINADLRLLKNPKRTNHASE